jgi:hypothetical protein
MHAPTLTWDSFQSLSSDAEAASASRFCRFSLATLEISCNSGTANLALIEREHADAWRWAVVSPDGFFIDAGSEPTRAHAKKAVERALRQESTVAAANFTA